MKHGDSERERPIFKSQSSGWHRQDLNPGGSGTVLPRRAPRMKGGTLGKIYGCRGGI